MSKDPFEAVINSGGKTVEKEGEGAGISGENTLDLKGILLPEQEKEKEYKVAKNMYINIQNAKWISKQAKKRGESDSVFVDNLLTRLRDVID